MRAVTKLTPSAISSTPAMAPTMVDRLMRRAIRATSMTRMVPERAAANRQPNGSYPNSHSPMAIICLPIGGCTTSP
ncbi:Uncharacterised protein [Mycobacteroides abscessus subsp. abscessus]|nr:Uncharacterised protein [Mycobacteroides abscessus subsp. abscessus]